METIQFKDSLLWKKWLESEGAQLAREQADVIITPKAGMPFRGSACDVKPGMNILELRTYDEPPRLLEVDLLHDASALRITGSRRLDPARAYASMKEMERAGGVATRPLGDIARFGRIG